MKFSIVTPAYNMERWISETIESVLSQEGDFEIEYIVMDDGSKDRTAVIARQYAERVAAGSYPIRCGSVNMRVVTQENTGMYEAINRGFARSTGDIFAWINADDVYKSGAFRAMAASFSAFPEAQWIKGITTTIEEDSRETRPGACRVYRQDWLRDGVYGAEAYFVEQDSVFWRRELWQKAGPMPKHMRSAADYWLWIHMAKHAPLWSLNVPISSFRKREGQISKGIERYRREQAEARPKRPRRAWVARIFFAPQSRIVYRLPSLEPIFLGLYSLLYSRREDSYIEIVGGKPSLKKFPSYRI